ncbi:MAG: KH domain-containing protein [Desulfocapsaceae bacterium]|nr:KH domain-containing protein [Desulfocapsaceae bacterium]
MEELINYIAKALVDKPEEVKTVINHEEDNVNIELTVAQEDLGKVIGKQGRTARAMRTLLSAAAEKEHKKTRLDILE